MYFHFRRIDALLRLEERFFAEGVWDGSSSDGPLDASTRLMGSEGRTTGWSVVFATPSRALERRHIARRGASWFVSISPGFGDVCVILP